MLKKVDLCPLHKKAPTGVGAVLSVSQSSRFALPYCVTSDRRTAHRHVSPCTSQILSITSVRLTMNHGVPSNRTWTQSGDRAPQVSTSLYVFGNPVIFRIALRELCRVGDRNSMRSPISRLLKSFGFMLDQPAVISRSTRAFDSILRCQN